jgi:hypothetical protein
MEETAMPIRPIHHRRHSDPTLLIWFHFLVVANLRVRSCSRFYAETRSFSRFQKLAFVGLPDTRQQDGADMKPFAGLPAVIALIERNRRGCRRRSAV